MKQAIWILIGLAATAALAAPFLLPRRSHDTDDIDGGVRHNNSYDAPKKIESSEIIEFYCEFSTLTMIDEGELGNLHYEFSAKLKDDTVDVSYQCYNRSDKNEKKSVQKDVVFMKQLQEIVLTYDLAQHNGLSYFVSGLPDMYGAILNVSYKSGESIYARNNQDNFLSYDAMLALKNLFQS